MQKENMTKLIETLYAAGFEIKCLEELQPMSSSSKWRDVNLRISPLPEPKENSQTPSLK